LEFASTAVVDGRVHFKGDNPPKVSPQARLASPAEFEKLEHQAEHESGVGHFIWLIIWAAASVLLGLVLFATMPSFAHEVVRSGEQYGISLGLGVLVLFGGFISAIIACITIVGLLVGISALILWIVMMMCTGIVVGAVIGRWILGPTTEIWPLIGRMAIGLLILRVLELLPYVGGWLKFAVVLWGMGAISLAIYRKLQPVIAPGIPPAPAGPGSPVPPGTPIGGMQTA
jgi:hypothetical protein